MPFTKLLKENGEFKESDDLRDIFIEHDIDLNKKIVSTCGSGVTACVIQLALTEIDDEDKRRLCLVYDGSWSEFGSRKKLTEDQIKDLIKETRFKEHVEIS